jgi:hypothetical protein
MRVTTEDYANAAWRIWAAIEGGTLTYTAAAEPLAWCAVSGRVSGMDDRIEGELGSDAANRFKQHVARFGASDPPDLGLLADYLGVLLFRSQQACKSKRYSHAIFRS